jgi:1-acyl-sn-glycerol-3-phosphate acyltransferase
MNFYNFAKFLCWAILRIGWRFAAVGVEHVPASGPLIVASNHVSYFDPPALGVALKRPVHYMAKQQLFAIPVLGTLIRWCKAYPVDRSRGDVAAIKRSVEVLASGAAIGIFPEGTRNPHGTHAPQSGIALLHYLSKAPVVPAYVAGTLDVRRFGRIRVAYGEPLSFVRPGEKASREDLAKWTAEIMKHIVALRETAEAV